MWQAGKPQQVAGINGTHLMVGDFVFYTIQDATYGDFAERLPIAPFREAEGPKLLVTREKADKAELPMNPYRGASRSNSIQVPRLLD